MRIYYAPSEGDSQTARCEAAIRAAIGAAKRLSLRDLQRRTSYHRTGVQLWLTCLATLEKTGEIRIAEGKHNQKIVILLKNKAC